MYFEEKMINGIMHYRTNPKAEFKPYSIAELSRRYVERQEYINRLNARLNEIEGI